jgi:alkylation response protein AidB-like acyl-CoA dehydrogenase
MDWNADVDLHLTSDQEVFREATVRFIRTSCPLDKVRELADDAAGVESGYLRQAAELGWFAMLVPEEYGGGSVSGNGLSDAAIVAEERGRWLQPGPFVPANVVADALAQGGGEEQRLKVLPAIAAGEMTATWVIAGVNGGWDPGEAVRCQFGGGRVLLRGEARLVQDALLADLFLVTAASDAGLTQVLVPAGTPGLVVEPLAGLDLTRRFYQVGFDGVDLPESALVGSPGNAAAMVERQFQVASALTVAEMVGAMDHDFEMTLDYAKARTAFGRPIGSFQAVKHLLADTSLLLETSKAAAAAAVRAVQEGVDSAEVASMAKAYVGDSAIDLAQNCWQVFGGISYTWEHDQHLYMRRLTTDAMLYGESAWHRERICALHEL